MILRPPKRPRLSLALASAVVAFGIFSSSVGVGALPTSSLPIFGVTNGAGSRATVAELGDVNGDGIGDYAVGLPNANGGSAWSTSSSGMRGTGADADRAEPRRGLVHHHGARRRDARVRHRGR